MERRASYGVDGFPYLILLLGGGTVLVLSGAALTLASTATPGRIAGIVALVVGAVALVPGFLGLRYVLGGKERHRDRLLDMVAWTGAETVLDVGTGAGLLAIGAAKRVPSGQVIACDIWATKDLSGNGIQRTLRNAEIEGVADRVDVRTGDARQIELDDATVDVVLSALCIHNIPDDAGRQKALSEVFRVLRPGGTAVIADLAGVDHYASWLTEAGCASISVEKAPGTFPPQQVLVAVK